jgi:hypothetical protein
MTCALGMLGVAFCIAAPIPPNVAPLKSLLSTSALPQPSVKSRPYAPDASTFPQMFAVVESSMLAPIPGVPLVMPLLYFATQACWIWAWDDATRVRQKAAVNQLDALLAGFEKTKPEAS